jgi:hypothetical protein
MILLIIEIKLLRDMKNFITKHRVSISKTALTLLALLIFSIPGISQAGISPATSTPNSSAGLDINFTTQGLLIPRIALSGTTSFQPLAAHVAGMIVYNTATAGDVVPGLYFNNGTSWVPSLPKSNAAGEMQYWDGTKWVSIPAGQTGQLLQINTNGVPGWVGAGYATIATTVVSGISATSAVSGGNITTDGGSPVTSRGVCWGTTPNPTIAGSKTSNGTGTGIFTGNLTGLVTATIYYLRSYATNSTGTSYGNQLIFLTL